MSTCWFVVCDVSNEQRLNEITNQLAPKALRLFKNCWMFQDIPCSDVSKVFTKDEQFFVSGNCDLDACLFSDHLKIFGGNRHS